MQTLDAAWRYMMKDPTFLAKGAGVYMGSMGVFHGLDVLLLFNARDNPHVSAFAYRWSSSMERAARQFRAYWGQFAHTLNPNGDTAPGTHGEGHPVPFWPQFEGKGGRLLRMQDPPTAMPVSGDDVLESEERCRWW